MKIQTIMVRIIAIALFTLMTSQAHAVVLKIATLSPEGSLWMKKMREGAKDVAQETNNRVHFKFYPGGVMGDDKAVLRKIRIGQLHGGAVVAGSLSKFYPDVQVYGLPLKFNTFEEVDYVRGHMDQLIIDGLEKSGFVTFGLAEGGFAYIMSKSPVRTIDDLRKQKMWIPDNDQMSLEILKAFGIMPIPLPIADVRAGLQTGLIDTVATSPIGAVALQWHTQVKYLTNAPLVYIYGFLAVDKKRLAKISSDDHRVIRDVMGRVFREIDRQNRENNVKAMEALLKQGIQLVKPPAEALDEWYAKASAVYERLIETGSLSRDIVNTLERNLADYKLQRSNPSNHQ